MMLGIKIKRRASDSAFRHFFLQVNVADCVYIAQVTL